MLKTCENAENPLPAVKFCQVKRKRYQSVILFITQIISLELLRRCKCLYFHLSEQHSDRYFSSQCPIMQEEVMEITQHKFLCICSKKSWLRNNPLNNVYFRVLSGVSHGLKWPHAPCLNQGQKGHKPSRRESMQFQATR